MAGIETNTGQDTAEQLHATAEQVKQRVEQRFGEQSGVVSRRMAGLAQALRTTAEQCDRQADNQQIAGYARHAADGVQQIGQVLEGKSLSEMLGELERVSRERPLLVGAAAVAAGLLGVRVTRTAASVHRTDAQADAARVERVESVELQEQERIMQSEGGI